MGCRFLHRSIILLICFGAAFAAQGQDPVFTQFYANPLQVNPAFAGVTYAPRLTLNYRNQWPGLNKAYVTYAASYEQALESLNSGVGLALMTDRAGDGIYKVNRIHASYGYKLEVKRDFHLKFGIEAGVIQNSVDWNKLLFGDQIDPISGAVDPSGNPILSQEAPPENLNKSVFDVGAGLLFYNQYFYGGVAVKHLNSPDESLLGINESLNIGTPIRFTVHGGAEFSLQAGNNRTSPSFISPNILFNQQGAFWQANVGAYAGLDQIYGGLWYRHTSENPDAVIGLIGYRKGILRIGYSYDFTISQLSDSNPGGTHEISFMINLEDSAIARKQRSAARYNNCFKMFN